MSADRKSSGFLSVGRRSSIHTAEITFIIVSYNSADLLESAINACLEAIHENNYSNAHIGIYDNDSSDRSPEIVRSYVESYPEVVLGFLGDENIGFGRANNRVAQFIPSNIYVLVNPDVTFHASCIFRLRKLLESQKTVAIVCPKLLYLDDTIQPSARHFPTFLYFVLLNLFGSTFQKKVYPFQYYYENLEAAVEPFDVDWGIGAMMLVQGDYVRKYGLFDEQYFLYFEDVSLCLSAWQRGFRVIFDPCAIAYHKYQRASNKSRFNYLRLQHTISALKFFLKHRQFLI